jgi:hypothetical protein
VRRWVACGLALLAGCINEERRLYEVELRGEVTSPGTVRPARVVLELHHAQTGAGPLATPLGFIDATELAGPGPATWTTLVPIEEGEGLVLYGWLDVDGDGLLCAPGGAPEPAGAAEVDGFPGHVLEFSLMLETSCAGPSAVYPP